MSDEKTKCDRLSVETKCEGPSVESDTSRHFLKQWIAEDERLDGLADWL